MWNLGIQAVRPHHGEQCNRVMPQLINLHALMAAQYGITSGSKLYMRITPSTSARLHALMVAWYVITSAYMLCIRIWAKALAILATVEPSRVC